MMDYVVGNDGVVPHCDAQRKGCGDLEVLIKVLSGSSPHVVLSGTKETWSLAIEKTESGSKN